MRCDQYTAALCVYRGFDGIFPPDGMFGDPANHPAPRPTALGYIPRSWQAITLPPPTTPSGPGLSPTSISDSATYP